MEEIYFGLSLIYLGILFIFFFYNERKIVVNLTIPVMEHLTQSLQTEILHELLNREENDDTDSSLSQ
jgi:hypothetical protein